MCKLFKGSWQCGVDKNYVILGKTVCRFLSFTSDFACKSEPPLMGFESLMSYCFFILMMLTNTLSFDKCNGAI